MNKAKQRLKELVAFSPNLETFVQLFYDSLDNNRQDEAIAILLESIYDMLTSPGEQFNELLEKLTPAKKTSLLSWLEDYRSQV